MGVEFPIGNSIINQLNSEYLPAGVDWEEARETRRGLGVEGGAEEERDQDQQPRAAMECGMDGTRRRTRWYCILFGASDDDKKKREEKIRRDLISLLYPSFLGLKPSWAVLQK